MNRCQNTGLDRQKPLLNPIESAKLRKEIDVFLDQQIENWKQKFPMPPILKAKKSINSIINAT